MCVPAFSAVQLKWNHSIVADAGFVSSWAAVDRARALASDLGFSRCQFGRVQPSSSRLPRVQSRRAPAQMVRFASSVQVLLGDDSDLLMHCLPVPMATFVQWHDKPWRVSHSYGPLQEQPPFKAALGCSAPNVTSFHGPPQDSLWTTAPLSAVFPSALDFADASHLDFSDDVVSLMVATPAAPLAPATRPVALFRRGESWVDRKSVV